MNKTKTLFLLFLVAMLCLSTIPLVYADEIVDSYSESHYSENFTLKKVHPSATVDASLVWQTFQMSLDYKATRVVFYLKKQGLPVGNYRFAIYSHTGTWGVTGKPSVLLVESGDYAMADLSTEFALIEWTLAVPYQMDKTLKYCAVLYIHDATLIDIDNYVIHGIGPNEHPGNYGRYRNNNFDYLNSKDGCFYVYGDPPLSNIDIAVENNNGDPIEGAYAYLNDSITSDYTDENGIINFTDVLHGAYLLTIEKSCYHTYTVEFDLTEETEIEVTLQGGQEVMLLYLMVALAVALTAFGFVAKIQGEIPKLLTVLICSISGVVMLIVFLWVFFTCIGI